MAFPIEKDQKVTTDLPKSHCILRVTKLVIIIFSIQMLTTFLPLILLPRETWQNIMILSLPGQYILKNIVLVASAFTIYKDCQVSGWKFSKISFASFFQGVRH